MRKFRVNVNGQSYEVEIEEVGQGAPQVPARPARPEPVRLAPPPAPAPAAPAPAAASRVAAAGGGEVVHAPLPGMVVAVKVEPGQRVEVGQVLLVLEAMKMENDIVAPVGGTVKEVAVSKGTSVATGDVLVVIG